MSTTQVTISWEGYEFNNFIISYGSQSLSNPEDGAKIYVINSTNYTFANLISNEMYGIYLKTDCVNKSSFWIGPLLIFIEPSDMNLNGNDTSEYLGLLNNKSDVQSIAHSIINSKSMYNLIKTNDCILISCNNDWNNSKNIILPNSGLCIKNCGLTSTKYQYKGNCYNDCQKNTKKINYECYSNSIIEKCATYSIESDYENLCITCQNDYYIK